MIKGHAMPAPRSPISDCAYPYISMCDIQVIAMPVEISRLRQKDPTGLPMLLEGTPATPGTAGGQMSISSCAHSAPISSVPPRFCSRSSRASVALVGRYVGSSLKRAHVPLLRRCIVETGVYKIGER
jgi:hypothetical protein